MLLFGVSYLTPEHYRRATAKDVIEEGDQVSVTVYVIKPGDSKVWNSVT
jgi:hypothetical protein